MKSDEREKGKPARRPGARRARSSKPRSMPDISPSRASSLSIQPQDVSLNRMLETLKPHDHLCLIYDSPEEWRACVVSFISIGLKHGEKCCYFADAHTAEQLHGYLQAEGVDVASTEASGQLVILCESEAYTKEGSFDPDLMISLLITETEKAIAEGYPALRVTGEMTWVLRGHPGSERLLEYEAKLNRDFFPKYPALGICQYDRWKFDPEIIKGVIMTHSLLVRGNHIYHNSYYIPPEEFLNRKGAELEVQHWLNNVEREQRIMDTLRESEKRYRTLFERTANPILAIDTDGNYIDGNEAALQFLECTREELLTKNTRDFLPPSKERQMIREHLPLWKSGGRVETEHYVNGKLKVLDLTITPGVWRGKQVVFGVGIDITERKRAEETLRRSEERYHTIIEDMDEGYFELDLAGNFTVVNDAHCRNLGYSREELVGMHYSRVVHEEDPEAVRKGLKRMFKTGQPNLGLHRKVLRKDGSIRFAEVSMFPLRSEDGKITGFRGIGWDITERKHMEESLRLSEQNFRDSIENSPLGIRIANEGGKTLYANRALLDIYGYSSVEELEAVPRKQRYTPESYAEHRERAEKRKRGEHVPPSYEISIVCSDGQVRCLSVSRGEVLWNGEKQSQVVYQDITERKVREVEYQTIIRTAIDGFWLVDMQGHFLDMNEAYCHLTGYSRDELLNMAIPDVEAIEKPEETAKRIRKIKEVGYDRFETRHRRKDGEIIDVGISVNYLPIDGGRMFVFIRDITERKRAEEMLKASEAKYRNLVEQAWDAIFVVDASGKILLVNQQACQMLGYTEEELLQFNIADTYPVEQRGMAAKRIAMAQGGQPLLYDRLMLRKDGTTISVEVNIGMLPNGLIQGIIRDITERKRAEETLSKSEAKYRLLAENVRDVIWTMDMNLRFTYMSPSVEYLRGYTAEEVMSQSLEEIFTPSSVEVAVKAFEEELALESMEQKDMSRWRTLELEHLCRDGSTVWVEIKMTFLRDQDGQPVGIVGVSRDITERKLAEEALWESEEKYRSVVERANDGICVIQDGIIKYLNPRLAEMGSGTVEELIDTPFIEHLHPDNLREMANLYKRRLAGEDVTPLYEVALMRKDGSRLHGEVNAGLIKYKGKPADLVIIRDITERKKAEEALRQSEKKYRTILSEMQDSYFEVDLAGNLTFFNDSTSNSLGYSAEELMGMSYREFTVSEDIKLVYKVFNKVYRTNRPNKGFLWKVVRKDGTLGFVEATVSPLRNPKGEIIGFRGVGRDITERKRTEEERRQLELKAQVTSRLASVGEMAAGVAHEINNPLTGVIGYAQLLMDGKDIPSDIRRDLAAINEGAQRVASIVKRLLAFSRQVKPERRDVDINELIESTLSLRAYHLRVNNIKVTTQLAPDLPETVADPGQLQQVVLNLVVNAETEMKLAHGKGKLLIKTEKVDNTIRISFKDNGPGIAKKNLERIFDPFFTTREVGQGTGLGLSLCHGIVAEHNGKIYAESKLGKGATFVVELPVVTEAKQPKPSEPVVEEPEKVAKARILVVDDEQVIRDLVKRVLAGEGYEVETVDNAGDALKKIEGKRYNLVLLDIKMPGMDGVELYRRIQKIAKSLARRVVFITGDILGAHTEKFLSETKVARIDKPFSAEQLKREVRRVLTGG